MMRTLRVLLVAGALAAPAAADTITFADGRPPLTGVTVLDETYEKVEYKLANVRQTQTLPAEKVDEVVYENPGTDFETALENYEAGAYGDASGLFRAAASEAERRKKMGLAARALYLAAEALRRDGQPGPAAEAFDALVQAQPKSRYVPIARLNRGIALLEAGNETEARAAFEQLRRDAASFPKRWEYEATLRLQMLDETKDPQAAMATYERLASEAGGEYPSVANQARLRIGRVLIAQKKFDEARQYFENIIANRAASSAEVKAGAYNGLGASLYLKPKPTDEELKRALYAFLRTIVSYSDVQQAQPEALYYAGKLFQRVPVADGAARARSLLERVIRNYPESSWALEARKG